MCQANPGVGQARDRVPGALLSSRLELCKLAGHLTSLCLWNTGPRIPVMPRLCDRRPAQSQLACVPPVPSGSPGLVAMPVSTLPSTPCPSNALMGSVPAFVQASEMLQIVRSRDIVCFNGRHTPEAEAQAHEGACQSPWWRGTSS